jgi:HAD superfamily hydrolase (TIGR01509 family)
VNRGLDLGRVQALCFDLDGTIVDTDDAFIEWLSSRIGPLARLFSLDTRQWARRLVLSAETPANFLFGLPDRFGLDTLLRPLFDRRWRGEPSRRYRLVPGVRGALEQLEVRYPLAIVSVREAKAVADLLDAFDLRPFFRCVATAGTVHRTKPHPAPIHWAAAQLGVPSQACAVIGDTVVDIRAGRDAGAQTVGVLCGFGEQEELERAGADLILGSTADLAAALLGCES